jgi:hypothetical protein
MADQDELVWIQDAVASYRRSREWLNKQMREGRLDRVGLPGDGKVYLRRSQLAELVALQKAGEKAPSFMAGMNRPLPFDKRLF